MDKKLKLNDRMQGILFIILAGFFFSLMSLCVRLSGSLPTFEKAFFRNLVAAIASIIMLAKSEEKFHIQKSSWPSLFMRAACGTAGLLCNFYAVDRINLADANMLNKLSPFFAIIFSVFILHEVANKTEWLCTIIAFIGALFIIRPSLQIESFYGFMGLLGGLGAGVAYVFVRKLGKQGERSTVIVMFFSVFSCAVTLPLLIMHYVPMSIGQLSMLLLAGVFATGGQLSITKAYTKAPAKEISVFDYTQILFSACWAMLFLGEVPDKYSIIGYVVIISVAVYKWVYNLKT